MQIGGEHEDSYDDDFCIYNDVLVHDGVNEFRLFGYPRNVFPPTDFHTATYYKGFIYIVGGLGDHGQRQSGFTPVYRLNCEDWSIRSVATMGDQPGWIYKHSAKLQGSHQLVVSGGKIQRDGNESNFAGLAILDLEAFTWSKVD